MSISNQLSHYLLVLLVKFCKGNVNSTGVVSAGGTCMSCDGTCFSDFPAIREGCKHDDAGVRVSASDPPILSD